MQKKKRVFLNGLALAVVAALTISFGTSVLLTNPASAQSSLDEAGLPTGERPVVVELYTSQGCNSCPPADDLLGELAKIPGVLALSFHIDYWDYIGWKDTFASPRHTERQRHYARELELRYIYTPQMVVDGAYDAAGFRQRQVFGAMEKALHEQIAVPITIAGDGRSVRIESGENPGEGATVYLAMFDREHSVSIGRGENTGRELVYHNVVRDYRELGQWDGNALEIELDPAWAEGRDGCAIILQSGRTGRIIGASTLMLDGADS